jgi:hypothetical protein
MSKHFVAIFTMAIQIELFGQVANGDDIHIPVFFKILVISRASKIIG